MFIEFRIFEEIPVASCGKYKITLEGEMGQHKAPHVHLKEKAQRLASIAIADGYVLAGRIPGQIRKIVQRWIEKHREELLHDWKEMQNSERPREYTDFGPC